MKNARCVLMIGILLMLAAPVSTEATTVRAFSTRDMVQEAALVVRGKILSQKAIWSRNNTIIVTESTLRVDEALVGRNQAKVITIRQLGGTVGQSNMHVAGVAPLKTGQEVLIFLRSNGKHHFVVGMAQGFYRVVKQNKKTIVTRELEGLNLLSKGAPVGHRKPKRANTELLYSTFSEQIKGYAKELGRIK